MPFSSEDMHDIDDKEDRVKLLTFLQELADKQDEFWIKYGLDKFIHARMDRAAKLTAEQGWVGELWDMPEEPQPQPEAAEDEMQLA